MRTLVTLVCVVVLSGCACRSGSKPTAERPCPPRCCKGCPCKIITLENRQDLWGPNKVDGPYTRKLNNRPRAACLIEEAPPSVGKAVIRPLK